MNLPVNYNECSIADRKLVREEYTRLQNGKCYHCGMLLTEEPSYEILALWIDRSLFPERFFNWPVHLHHNHDTGMTIGAVHCRCNAALWQYHGE